MADLLFTRQEILDHLDDCARRFIFPMLDNGYVYPADVRLTAFRDHARWSLVIETLGANPRGGEHDSLFDSLYRFGNCLNRPVGLANEDFLFLTADGDDGPTFEKEYGWHVRDGLRTIRIRDTLLPVSLEPEALQAKGIRLEEPPNVNGAELLRALLPDYRDLLLAREEELRERVPVDLPLILRLDQWHHPDLVRGELPGGNETFQLIAEVLASGEAARYQPTQPPNTHWSNWPEGGTL